MDEVGGLEIVDLIIVVFTLAAAAWGFREGINAAAFALLGFGAGAVLGSRVAPLILDGGYEDPYAPAIALPAAILFGAVLAAAFETLGLRLGRRTRTRGIVNAAGGALLAGCVALVGVWVVAALAARADDLRGDVRDSRIVERLNAALPPPGPLLKAKKRTRLDPLPTATGPNPQIGPLDPETVRDPQVRAAGRAVVKVYVSGCGRGGRGSGWVAGSGVIVTNAHVVERMSDVRVQPGGTGPLYGGQVTFYDRPNDVAVVRVPGLAGAPALPIGREAEGDTDAAALGFPGGGPYKVKAAKTAQPTRVPKLVIGGRRVRARVTPFRVLGIIPGSSGGPVIDRRGHVRTMTFAVRAGLRFGYGVPIRAIKRALRSAAGPVPTGSCCPRGSF